MKLFIYPKRFYPQPRKGNPLVAGVAIALITASATALFTFTADKLFEYQKNKKIQNGLQAAVEAELLENLRIANDYAGSKNQIISDVNFSSFVQQDRFHVSGIESILVQNFSYLNASDLYHLTLIRNSLNNLNSKLNILHNLIRNKPRISDSEGCNFDYFLPEEKLISHQYLEHDFNLFIYGVKHISFFSQNPYTDLNSYFERMTSSVSTFSYTYNYDEYKNVEVNCP